MSNVRCTNCGQELRDLNETPCPKCGDTRKSLGLEARMQIKLSAIARMTRTKIEKELQKNWPLIVALFVLDAFSTIPAYFLSGWASVGVMLLFIIISTVLGYYAITRVIRITSDTP
jgi:hypothetical protein